MFRGEYSHSIDPKGRLIIPAKFREDLGDEFVVTKEIGKGLSIYPSEGWRTFEEKLATLPRGKADIVRFFSGSAVDSGLDKQGRVQLSVALREYAELDKEVVIVGVLDRVEVWDKEKWIEKNTVAEESILEDMDELGF